MCIIGIFKAGFELASALKFTIAVYLLLFSVQAAEAQTYSRIIDDMPEQTQVLRLEGSEWDNTWIRGCKIHDTGGDGIFIKKRA